MGLREAANVIWLHLSDIALIHISGGDMPGLDEIAEPLRGERLALVVVGAHFVAALRIAMNAVCAAPKSHSPICCTGASATLRRL